MVISQAFNRKIKAWVKFDFVKGKGFKVLDVKQRKPLQRFRGVPVRGQRRR